MTKSIEQTGRLGFEDKSRIFIMLLSCCFREPKLKKEKQAEGGCGSDEEYSQAAPLAKQVKS